MAAGGVEEALLLITGEFEGWATGDDAHEWGGELAPNQVRVLQSLVAAADSAPCVKPKATDGRRAVAFVEGLLQASVAEVRKALEADAEMDVEESGEEKQLSKAKVTSTAEHVTLASPRQGDLTLPEVGRLDLDDYRGLNAAGHQEACVISTPPRRFYP